MPRWMNPDILTGIGVVGGLVIFASYILTIQSSWFLWLASLGLVINWFGDSLDGTLARYRNQQRPRYGFFIDHTIDALTEVLIVIGLGLSPYVRFDLALLALVGYLLLSVMVYVQQIVTNEFRISYGKLGPTEIRVIIILANTFIFLVGNPQVKFASFTLGVYDLIVIFITIVMLVIYITNTIVRGRVLSRQDTLARLTAQRGEE
jgi:phosphatidylglycerophosphate synthase